MPKQTYNNASQVDGFSFRRRLHYKAALAGGVKFPPRAQRYEYVRLDARA
ncbi:hypothetical protein HSBAA_51730 [Vreelandella sulfidaeris]|uniref:Uncharacterized protein n=1 Tax=Vreelandella sulfidaeris TaxID=115553 RepID=A0A455UE09_9GAMM|nr:hypothetical protein HSBAA_51730 [Halomonas sulfidaeris]